MSKSSYKSKDYKSKNSLSEISDHDKTLHNLNIQISIINRIITTWGWRTRDTFSISILYQISKYVFKNPIYFYQPIYSHIQDQTFDLKSKNYFIATNIQENLLRKKTYQQQIAIQNPKQIMRQKDYYCSKTKEIQHENKKYSIQIKIQKVWKKCNINQHLQFSNGMMTKIKHFKNIFKNIKIDNLKHVLLREQENRNECKDNNQQKQLYTLICDNYEYLYNKICEIQQNQKHKKFGTEIAHTYIQIMNKNFVILQVRRNNKNNINFRSQGKYIYFQNSGKHKLLSQKFNRIYLGIESYKIDQNQLSLVPYLKYQNENWSLMNSQGYNFQIFQQCTVINRSKGIVINQQLSFYQYDDFTLSHIQNL